MTWTSASPLSPARCLKFTDDNQLGINAADSESAKALQRELGAIGEWSAVRQMSFNFDKSHVLHMGTANQAKNHSLARFGNIQHFPRKKQGPS